MLCPAADCIFRYGREPTLQALGWKSLFNVLPVKLRVSHAVFTNRVDHMGLNGGVEGNTYQ